ncbi:MAG: hypothetical protein NVS3B10_32030 [Polyangiales bacterium]
MVKASGYVAPVSRSEKWCGASAGVEGRRGIGAGLYIGVFAKDACGTFAESGNLPAVGSR